MKRITFILAVVLGMAAFLTPKVVNAQLAYGSSVTSAPVLYLSTSNVLFIAPSRPNLVQRTIFNPDTTNALSLFAIRPVVSGSSVYNTFITTNTYNSTTIVAITNTPLNTVSLSSTSTVPSFAFATINAGATSNLLIGAELWGSYCTNGTSTQTTTVYTTDIYLQR